MGTDAPPGMTALNFLPCGGPPHKPYRHFLKGNPITTSYVPGRWTLPHTEKSFVPVLFGFDSDIFLYQSAPFIRIGAAAISVSTLLMVVGMPNTPENAGNGGFVRGVPATPLEGFHERRLLAADVRASAFVHVHVDPLAGAHRVPAEYPRSVRFL